MGKKRSAEELKQQGPAVVRNSDDPIPKKVSIVIIFLK